MLRLSSKITIQHFDKKPDGSLGTMRDKYNLVYVQDVKIQSSWETMMETASITLPKNVYVKINDTLKTVSWAKKNIVFKDSFGLSEKPSDTIFSVKDFIKIELGYNDKLETVFTGVLTSISDEAPISLTCSDVMWMLKDIQIKEQEFPKNVSLSKVLSFLNNTASANPDIQNLKTFFGKSLTIESSLSSELTLSGFLIRNQSIFQVLEELKANYELEIFVRDHVIYVGEKYPEKLDVGKKVIPFGKQFNIISDSLKGMKENDASVGVIVTGTPSTGSLSNKVKVEVGEGKNKIYLDKFDITDTSILKSLGMRKLSKIQYNGYKGHFIAFGTPFVRHGDMVNLRDQILVAKEGVYRVKEVEYSFGTGGYRQKIELHESVK